MSDMNDVRLFGRLVNDAELKATESGLQIARFSIAVNRTYRAESGEYASEGHFFPLALFGAYAEKMAPHLKKGQRVIVEGYLRQHRYQTQDGKARSETLIGVSRLQLIFDTKPKAALGADATNEASAAADAASGDMAAQALAAEDGDELQEMYESGTSADELYGGELSYGGDIF